MFQLLRRKHWLSLINSHSKLSNIARLNNHSNEKKCSTTIFSLFAPTIDEANLLTSATNWRSIPMEKNAKTGVFSIPSSLKINDGEHEYKYSIRKNSKNNIWATVIDPYVEKYDSKHRNGLVKVQNGKIYKDTYEWKYDHIKLPNNDQLIIYELFVNEFTENGRFTDILDKLKHLVDLGINAIALLPIQDYIGKEYDWGYNPAYPFTLRSSYGTKHDLKVLIDECHAHGIRVFFDGIFNHSSIACPLVHIDKNYWYHKDTRDFDKKFYYGPEFNYDYYDNELKLKPSVKYAQDIVRYWISEFHFDGIRFDHVKKTKNTNILYELSQTARMARFNQPFFTQAQHQSELSNNFHRENYNSLNAYASTKFHDIICNLLTNPNTFEIDRLKSIINQRNFINYLSNHGTKRFMKIVNQYDHSFQRANLAAIILMTSVSTPLLWQGDEFGQSYIDKQNHCVKHPLDWSLMERDDNKTFYNIFKRLIEFRRSIINKGQYSQAKVFHEDLSQRIIAYTRTNEIDNEDVIIVTNFSHRTHQNYEIRKVRHNGLWVDWLTNDIYTVNGSILKLDLKRFDGKIILRQK